MTEPSKTTHMRDESRALEDRGTEADGRLFSPSAARNRDVILQTLASFLADAGGVLEIASGTGEHGAHIAAVLPHIFWQPSDPDPRSRASIAAWRDALGLENMAPPLDLMTTDPGWAAHVGEAMDPLPAAIVCINMIHIAPWAACEGLFRGAGELLQPGGLVYLYGPFATGPSTAPSNRAFDQDLRRRNAEWGVRDLDEVVACAARNGLTVEQKAEMPANNLSLIFRRS